MEDSFQGVLEVPQPIPTSFRNVFFIKSVLFFTAKNSKVLSFCLKIFPSQLKTVPQMSNADLRSFEQSAHPNMQEPCL